MPNTSSMLALPAAVVKGLPAAAFGSMTMKRRPKKRGFEPDECTGSPVSR
jgi:hypothetical protein